jgi:hypothetical protein
MSKFFIFSSEDQTEALEYARQVLLGYIFSPKTYVKNILNGNFKKQKL